MVTTQSTLDENETIDTAYPCEIRVIRVDREDDEPIYRFEAPMHHTKDYDTGPEWHNPHKARMYAAVYAAAGPFREEKTGRRGIPPELVRDGREAVVAYMTTQPGMSTEWISNFFDLDRERIYEYRSRIKNRAEEWAEEEHYSAEVQGYPKAE